MKSIKLKTIAGETENEPTFAYREVIDQIVTTPENPKEGANIEEIIKSIRVKDALREAKEELVLEDADYEYLKRRVKNFRYPFSHRAIVELNNDIMNAEDVKNKTKK